MSPLSSQITGTHCSSPACWRAVLPSPEWDAAGSVLAPSCRNVPALRPASQGQVLLPRSPAGPSRNHPASHKCLRIREIFSFRAKLAVLQVWELSFKKNSFTTCYASHFCKDPDYAFCHHEEIGLWQKVSSIALLLKLLQVFYLTCVFWWLLRPTAVQINTLLALLCTYYCSLSAPKSS